MNYTRPLGKRSLFWQHLVSTTVPPWQAIVVRILDGKYCMYGGLEVNASIMLLFVEAKLCMILLLHVFDE